MFAALHQNEPFILMRCLAWPVAKDDRSLIIPVIECQPSCTPIEAVAVADHQYLGTLAGQSRRAQIETALALGATPREAARAALSAAIQAAMIAPINHLMIVGLIQIPGVTTGLLLADQDPGTASRYQLVISYAIVSSVAITAAITARLVMRELFTARGQLRVELLE